MPTEDVELETRCNPVDPEHKGQPIADDKVSHIHVEPLTEMSSLNKDYENGTEERWKNPETAVENWLTTESD